MSGSENMPPKQTDPQFKLRLPPDVRAEIEAAAARNMRSLSAEILARIDGSRETDITWLKSEMTRLRKERDAAYKQTRDAALLDIDTTLTMILPEGLLQRVQQAATEHGRPVLEEVVQALEIAFPPPPTLDDIIASLEGLFERVEGRRKEADEERDNRLPGHTYFGGDNRMRSMAEYLAFLKFERDAGRGEGARERFKEEFEELPDGTIRRRGMPPK